MDSISETYLISDLHFGHDNIIKYCARPYHSVNEMNWALVSNWNGVVNPSDTVYFLGDFAFRNPAYWASLLNGRIEFIKGSHDKRLSAVMHDYLMLDYSGIKFYLTHDSINAPKYWDSWVICGHKHNHDLINRPLINGDSRVINVSAELINYTPLSINHLFNIEFNKIKCLKDLLSEPVYY